MQGAPREDLPSLSLPTTPARDQRRSLIQSRSPPCSRSKLSPSGPGPGTIRHHVTSTAAVSTGTAAPGPREPGGRAAPPARGEGRAGRVSGAGSGRLPRVEPLLFRGLRGELRPLVQPRILLPSPGAPSTLSRGNRAVSGRVLPCSPCSHAYRLFFTPAEARVSPRLIWVSASCVAVLTLRR